MTQRWQVWVAVAFVGLLIVLSLPFLTYWLWIATTFGAILAGLALIVWAIRRRKAEALVSSGSIPPLSSEPPDAP